MESIRIVIADDHTLFRAGLKRLLTREKDLLVTGEAERAEDAEPAVARGKADVLLLDLKMPGGEAVQTLLDLDERHPRTRTLILTAFDHEDSILDTAKAGARGYVLKGVSPTTLFQAIRTVHEGGIWIDPGLRQAGEFSTIASRRTRAETARKEPDGMDTLSRREMEVLRMVAEGLSNREIAANTFVSERTVKAHLANIFAKLDVNNRVKAALAFLRRN